MTLAVVDARYRASRCHREHGALLGAALVAELLQLLGDVQASGARVMLNLLGDTSYDARLLAHSLARSA
jgi:hypothetical protein